MVSDGADDSAARRLGDLPRRERARVVRRAALRSLASAVLVLVAYFVIPLDGGDDDLEVIVRGIIGLVLVAVVLVRQLLAILDADYPQLRGIEGLSLVIPLILVVFAGTYLSISSGDADAFSESLDHIGALYLAMMTMTTVGFGDIAANSELARIAVMVHMVANVAVIGVATRLGYAAVRRNLAQRD